MKTGNGKPEINSPTGSSISKLKAKTRTLREATQQCGL
jgi:hypothetical protein